MSSIETIARPVGNRQWNFVEALLSCPKLAEGETLEISRDPADFGRDVEEKELVTRNVEDMVGMGVPILNPFA